MPTIVTDEEHRRHKAKMVIGGQPLEPDYFDRAKMPLQTPLLDMKKEKEIIEPRKITTTFTIKLRYNMKGRKKTKYNEWPMIIQTSLWQINSLIKVGLAEIIEENPSKVVKLYGDAPDSYAIYENENNTRNWLLREYEGSIH
jgi:hypothetical protein